MIIPNRSFTYLFTATDSTLHRLIVLLLLLYIAIIVSVRVAIAFY